MKESIVCCSTPDDAEHMLVCFPHAGGSVKPYLTWSIAGVRIAAVCYPGRDRRTTEPCATDLIRLADELAQDLYHVDLPLALFGHSMGAAVALETARSLEAAGRPVVHLFASGTRESLRFPEPEPVGTDDDLIRAIAEMGGTDERLIHTSAFAELVLPYLRADADMFRRYTMIPMNAKPQLSCPVTTIVGDQDIHAYPRPWSALSPSHREHSVMGGHFYFVDAPPLHLVAAGLGYPDTESEMPQ